jgi:hypothetical protein
MFCKLAQLDQNGSKIIMTCDEIREKQYDMKANFRKVNRSDEVMKHGRRDRMYDEYCAQIDSFLDQCPCVEKIALICDKCPESDHEGHFCRCEDRNIALAKQLRRAGIRVWNSGLSPR